MDATFSLLVLALVGTVAWALMSSSRCGAADLSSSTPLPSVGAAAATLQVPDSAAAVGVDGIAASTADAAPATPGVHSTSSGLQPVPGPAPKPARTRIYLAWSLRYGLSNQLYRRGATRLHGHGLLRPPTQAPAARPLPAD